LTGWESRPTSEDQLSAFSKRKTPLHVPHVFTV